MKALFISNDPNIFTEMSSTRIRMRAYAEAIGELHIVSPAISEAKEVHEGVLHLYPVHAWRLFRVSALARAAKRIIQTQGIEVVSAQDPFEQGLAALRATQDTSAKLHIQVHTDFLSPWFTRSGSWRALKVSMPFKNRFRQRIADRVLPQAQGIRVVSERIKSSLIKRYGGRIPEPSVIPIPIDTNTPAPAALPPHQFTFALIAVGRLEAEKRIEDILAALNVVLEKYPTAGLFLVGEGRERARLERRVCALKLTDRVVFLGSRNDARALMGSAQAFIQASAYEGYGLTLLEAALAKVPIITTDVGIVGEVFKGYEDVLASPVADPMALAYDIIGLIEDVQVRLALPMHAEAAARKHLETLHNTPADIAADLARLVTHG